MQPTEPFDTQTEQKRLIEAIERAIVEFPNDARLVFLAATTYAEFLQTDRAIELFEKSLKLDATNATVLVAYSDMLLQIGRSHEAVERSEAGRKAVGDTPALRIALARAYGQTAQPQKAFDLLRDTTFGPEYLAASKLELARVQNQLGLFEEAEQNARLAMENGHRERGVYQELSTALMRLGKREEAMQTRRSMPPIEQQITPGEQKYQVWFRKLAGHTYATLGSAYAAKGLYEAAEVNLRYAAAMDATSEEATGALVGLLRNMGRMQEAFELQNGLVKAVPDNMLHLANLASLATAVQNFEVAEASLRKAAELDDSGQAELRLAQFLMGVGKPTEAVQAARQVVAKTESLDAYLVLLVALRNQGDRLETVAAFLEAQKKFPNAPQLAGFQP